MRETSPQANTAPLAHRISRDLRVRKGKATRDLSEVCHAQASLMLKWPIYFFSLSGCLVAANGSPECPGFIIHQHVMLTCEMVSECNHAFSIAIQLSTGRPLEPAVNTLSAPSSSNL